MSRYRKNKIKNITCFDYLNVIFMVIVAIATLYPFYYCFVLSFNDGKDALMPGIYFWPRKFTLDNYSFILSNKQLLISFRNSILRTVIGTFVAVFITASGAYALTKRHLIGRRFYLVFFIITMYFSGGMIPTYLVYKKIGLIDNFLVYILPPAWSYYNALLCMAYFDSIPVSLEESAYIDGASPIYIFIKIIIPVSTPIIATISLFIGVWHWNYWFDTMIYTTRPELQTLQNLLMIVIREAENMIKLSQQAAQLGAVAPFEVTPVTVRVATMIVTTFPIIIVFPPFRV
jgi:putative aldouronate transport system permease protein